MTEENDNCPAPQDPHSGTQPARRLRKTGIFAESLHAAFGGLLGL